MKIKEYMRMVHNLENREYVPGESFDELIDEYENMGLGTKGFKDVNEEQEAILNQWGTRLDKDLLSLTPFYDKIFLAEFLKTVPEEEQFKYVENTNNYQINSVNGYDPQYVIVTRRAVPSLEPKPEQFWSTEHNEVLMGLTYEIPRKTAHREHSIIMVSTLQNLYDHGRAKQNNGVSDGEIITASAPFTEDEMLFVYKPLDELYSFSSFILNGGMKNEEILKLLKEASKERADKIGLRDEETIEENIEEKAETIKPEKEGNNLRLTNEFLDSLNQTLLNQKVVLPNGNMIQASYYIEEIVRPLIPENGKFKLKNGVEISARQYIEEFVLGEGQTKYNGDIHALMQDTLAGTDEPPQRDGWNQPTHGKVMETQVEQEADTNTNTKDKINISSFKKSLANTRDREKIGLNDVKGEQDKIALRQEIGKLVSLSMRGQLDENGKRRLEEINNMLNIRNLQQRSTDKGQNKGKYTGQSR